MERRRIISCNGNDSQQSQHHSKYSNYSNYLNHARESHQVGIQKSSSDGNESPIPVVSAISWSIHDYNTGDLLWGKQATEQREMASLTKVMTLLATLETCQKYQISHETIIIVPRNASLICGTSACLIQGDKLTIKDLMYGLMLPSGNDAALVLSNFLGSQMQPQRRAQSASGSYNQIFVNHMNKLAKQLQLKKTNFSNPHGLSEKSNRSTAQDLGKLSAYLLKNYPICQEISSTKTYKCSITQQNQKVREVIWSNTNILLDKYGFEGLKTGWTPNAGWCFIGYYESGEIKLVITVLQSKSNEKRFSEVEKQFKIIKKLYRLAYWAERRMNFVRKSIIQKSPIRIRNIQSSTIQNTTNPLNQQHNPHRNSTQKQVKAKILAQISNNPLQF